MDKSKIIQQLANSEIDLKTALKRLKVLLSYFDRKDLNHWVDCELMGYSNDDTLPCYRIVCGTLEGKISSCGHIFSYQPLSISCLPQDIYENFINNIKIYDSVSQIIEYSRESNTCKILPPECYFYFEDSENSYSVIKAYIKLYGQFNKILSVIENRVLDILLLLEKEFGNLDGLDIDLSRKTTEEKEAVIKNIYNIIQINNIDKSLCIGDNNSISETSIAGAESKIL